MTGQELAGRLVAISLELLEDDGPVRDDLTDKVLQLRADIRREDTWTLFSAALTLASLVAHNTRRTAAAQNIDPIHLAVLLIGNPTP